MVEVLLTRHGESEANRELRFGGQGDTPLTDEGHAQARALAAALVAERGLTQIISSDLLRATQTAAAVASATGLSVVMTPALRERHIGDFTGLTYADAKLRDAAAFEAIIVRRDPQVRPPGGENADDILVRLAPVFDQLRAITEGPVLVVGHAITINVILRALLSSGASFFTQNCALHRLELGAGGRVYTRALNDTRHLVAHSSTTS